MQPKVSKGLATWAGIVAAAGQYALAVATFMSTFDSVDPVAGVGPLVTATAVLWKVINDRTRQADNLAQLAAGERHRSSWGVTQAPGQLVEVPGPPKYYSGTSPRPHAGGDFGNDMGRAIFGPLTAADDPDPDPPAGPSSRIADPMLDDPGLPTRAQHSHLKG